MENIELKVGGVYDLKINGRGFGKCLYLGPTTDGSVYKHILLRRGGDFIFGVSFEEYFLTKGELAIGGTRMTSSLPHLQKFLDEVMTKRGI